MVARREPLDWESIRYFLHAAQAKSLSGAARLLQVEHTTVGRQLSSLEQALGVPLVDRGPAGLSLTPCGQRVLRLARQMGELATAIGEVTGSAAANVRLVVPTGFTALLTPHLARLREQHPGIELEIVSGGRRANLRKREADLAIRVGPIDDQDLVARKLGEVGSALYASRSYLALHPRPTSLDDLTGHALIGFHATLAQMPAAQWLAARSAGAHVVMRSREAVDMLAAAKSGAGLAVLPCFLADPEAALVRLTRAPIASRRLSLVYRRSPRASVELRAVIALVIALARERAPALAGHPT
jgi:DNA-binding transcriptional LysR family regulator